MFEALSQMAQIKNKIRVNFYGRQISNLNKDIKKFGLTSIVRVFKEVSYEKSLIATGIRFTFIVVMGF